MSSAPRRTVFIVEDDPSLRLGLQRLLDQHGFEIEVFDSAEDFEEHADLVSVDHPQLVQNFRDAHSVYERSQQRQAETEELRRSLLSYRALFEELLA